jgi:hypothetical protein
MNYFVKKMVSVVGLLLTFAFSGVAQQQPDSTASTLAASPTSQPASVGQLIVGQSVKQAVSLPLSELAAQAALQVSRPPTVTPPRRFPPSLAQRSLTLTPQGAVQQFVGTTLLASPTLNLDGLGQGLAVLGGPPFVPFAAPPDTNGAVGLTQYVQTVNSSYIVINKATGAYLTQPISNNTLWHGFGGPCETTDSLDPIILYDKLANRWIMSGIGIANDAVGPFFECIAVSKTSDAMGTWNLYAFNTQGINLQGAVVNAFADFPKMGVWPDAYFMGFNVFADATGVGDFFGPEICAFSRNDMLQGTPVHFVCDALPRNQPPFEQGFLMPSDLDGTNPPPAGSPNYFLTSDSAADQFRLYKFHPDFTTLTATLPPPTAIPFAVIPGLGLGSPIPQPGTTQFLQGDANTLNYRLSYRNFGDHESLVINEDAAPPDAHTASGVAWYEIRNPNGTPSIFQQSLFSPDNTNRWMGSIATDKLGDMLLGYSVSDATTVFPAIRITGRVPTDSLGTMETEMTVVVGGGAQLPTPPDPVTGSTDNSRWGDYSSMSVDPVDDCTFWYTQEYIKAPDSGNAWNTRIANFKFPSCASTPDFSLSQTPGSQIVTAGATVTYNITVSPMAGFNGAVSFTAVGLPAGATAAFSPTSITGSGSTTLSISTTQATAVGNYVFAVTGTSGTLTHSATLLLTVNSFTLAVTPSSRTITAGQVATYTATISPLGGFNDNVTFAATGLPSGATATFTPASVTGSGSTTMTITTTSATTGGNSTITVTATSAGGATRTATVTLNTSDFSLVSTPTLRVVATGNSSTYTINLSTVNQFSDGVSLSISGLPASSSAAFAPASISGAAASTLTITTTATTPPGIYSNIVVTGTDIADTTITRTVPIALTVTDFSISTSPASQTISPGASTSYTVTVSDVGGFGFGDSAILSLNPSTLPSGVQGTFSVNPITVGSSILTITSTSATPTGQVILAITGSDGNDTHTANVTLNIVPLSPVACISPTSLTFTSQNVGTTSAAQTVGLTNCGGSPLALSSIATVGDFAQTNNCLATLPVGSGCTIQLTFTPTASGARTGALSITDNAAGSPQAVALNGTGVVLTQTFTLTASPTTQAVIAGSSTTYTITTTAVNGFTGTVTPSVTGLPAGATAAFSPATITGGAGTTTLTVFTTGAAPGGTSTLTISGTSGADVHSATVTLGVSNFSLTATPTTQAVTAGGSTSYTMTVAAVNGFTGTVTPTVAGLPAGATATFSPATITGGAGTTTLTVSTTSASPGGTSTLTISGTSGADVHTATVTLAVSNFSLTATPATQQVLIGASTSYAVTVATVNGFTGTVTPTVTGLPAGATASFSPATIAGSGTSTLTITTAGTTPAATSTLTITGTSGTDVQTATTTLAVVDFTLAATPTIQTVAAGNSTTYTITTTAVNGFTGTVTPTVTGLPAGATASFSPATIAGAGATTLTIVTTTAATQGSFTLTVSGTSGPRLHTATVSLTVQGLPDFSITVTPATQQIVIGGTTSYTVTVTPLNGFTGTVTLALTGLPVRNTATFSPTSIVAGGSSTLTIITSLSNLAGNLTLTISGTSGSLTHSATATLGLQAFDVTLPGSPSVFTGGSASSAFAITPLNGFNGTVTPTVTGLPANATATFNPASIIGGGTFTMTLTTSTSTPVGTYALLFVFTSDPYHVSGSLTLTVEPAPDFTLALSPASQSVVQGNSVNYSAVANATSTCAFTGGLPVVVTGLPAGATAGVIAGAQFGTSTVTIATSTSTPTGSYTLTMNASGCGTSHSGTVSLTVNARIPPPPPPTKCKPPMPCAL